MRRAALCLLCACSFEHGRLPDGTNGGDANGDGPLVTGDAAVDAGEMPVLLFAYNIGGVAHTGSDFPGMWAADPGTVCDGSPWTENINVTNTVDDPLFQRYRFSTGGTINCALGASLPADTYEVTLVFGEVYIGTGCPDPNMTRVFDVLIEGTVVDDNLDTVAVGGCCNPLAPVDGMPFQRVYTRQVSDGTVNIALRSESSSAAMISAVMLRRL